MPPMFQSTNKKSWLTDVKASLEQRRSQFRDRLGPSPATIWRQFPGRIGAVLSGGGARGAYEAGVLLAFQDAGLPTHILTATSIGSINAACYAANSTGYVGNAEAVVQAWFDVTPPAVGIDWSRYVLVLGGLIASTAGISNLVLLWLRGAGIYFHLTSPSLTWFLLFLAGAAIVFFYDQISYLFYVLAKLVKGHSWKPDTRKLAFSMLANATVLAFAWILFQFAHLHVGPTEVFHLDRPTATLVGAGAILTLILWFFLRDSISQLSHKFLRLPFRSGLFPNFERTRFLRTRIPEDGLRTSPIRVVITAADLRTGREKFFVNCPPAELRRDPGVDLPFIEDRVETPEDLMKAIIASSAFPMAYELVEIRDGWWTDGGIVAKQPIHPAIRLGADVLFLIMVEPREQTSGEIKTFLDVGMRTMDVMMAQNLRTDARLLDNVNQICEQHARELGIRPEQICMEIGGRPYRYIKSFTVRPKSALSPALLDFDGSIAGPIVEQGYVDGGEAVLEFQSYLAQVPGQLKRRMLRLREEEEIARRQERSPEQA
jgi:predicted acylesterase/phospholipase RssA